MCLYLLYDHDISLSQIRGSYKQFMENPSLRTPPVFKDLE